MVRFGLKVAASVLCPGSPPDVYFTNTGVQFDVRHNPYVLWTKSIESCGFDIDGRVLKDEAFIQVYPGAHISEVTDICWSCLVSSNLTMQFRCCLIGYWLDWIHSIDCMMVVFPLQ